MKTLVWILSGALAMSCVLNFVQWRAACATEARAVTADSLGLTEEQVQRLTECCTDCCGNSAAIRADLAAEESRLEALLAQSDADPDEVARVTDRVGALRRELFESSVETVTKVRSVLSAEQLGELHAGCCGPKAAR